MMSRIIGIAVFMGWCVFPLTGQITFSQKLDSISMLIGDQRHLILSSPDQEIGDAPFMILDTLSWLHLVDRGSWKLVDRTYERNIVFTVFDSGYFVIPALGRVLEKDTAYTLGNPLSIEVNYPPDSLHVLRPIKSIEETQMRFRYLGLLIAAGILILGMLLILWFLFKADRIRPGTVQIPVEAKNWETSLAALKLLDEKKYWQNGNVKQYYDELNLILRHFLANGLQIPALENTSSEIMEYIHQSRTDVSNWEMLKDCFRESDFVKFANAVPAPEHNIKWMAFSQEFIKSNALLSETIVEETRVHWKALLGDELSSQFEYPLETVPKEFVSLCSSEHRELKLIHRLVNTTRFHLPEAWVRWHESRTGLFYRWHWNLLTISKHKSIQFIVMVLVLPMITLFIPMIWLVNLWNKQNLFSRGIFGLSAQNKLVIRNTL